MKASSQQHNEEDADACAPLLGNGAGIKDYLATCKDYQVRPCGDALIRLQLKCEHLKIEPDANHPFGNNEMQTLVALLQDCNGHHLKGLRSIDFTSCSLGPSGAMLVGHLLRSTYCNLQEVDISWQRINTEGALAILAGARESSSLRVLRMCNCFIGSTCGEEMVDFIKYNAGPQKPLIELDVQNNLLGYQTCRVLSIAALETGVTVCLHGNRVLDEILNAVSHGIGAALSIAATVMMALAVRGKPLYYTGGIVPYCISLILLFLSSTLYHSFHALGRTVNRIFCNLDHAAIYFLIAGTFTPVLVILLHDLWWPKYVLAFIWTLAGVGVWITVYHEGPYKQHIENFMYLFMGWSVCPYAHIICARVPIFGFSLLVFGGLMYTLGVPWFMKDGHTFGIPDHLTWHIFVLLACCSHVLFVYWFIVLPDPP